MPEPVSPCPSCGEHINDTIRATSPECPHGWDVAQPGDLAELYGDAWADNRQETP